MMHKGPSMRYPRGLSCGSLRAFRNELFPHLRCSRPDCSHGQYGTAGSTGIPRTHVPLSGCTMRATCSARSAALRHLPTQRRFRVGEFLIACGGVGGAIRRTGAVERIKCIHKQLAIAALGRCQRAGCRLIAAQRVEAFRPPAIRTGAGSRWPYQPGSERLRSLARMDPHRPAMLRATA